MTIVTITTDSKNLKKNQDYNDQSIQELEQRLNELVLQDPPHQTNSILELSTAAIKETFYNTHATCKKYFKPKVFSRKAVELLAVGSTIAGATYASQQSSTDTSLATNNFLHGSMNLLMYNWGFSYPQMLIMNLITYPVKSESFFGAISKVVGGVLGTFFGGRSGGFNVGISSQPITIKIDPAPFKDVIVEASKQVQFIVEKIEKAEENLVILSFEQAQIILREAEGIVQVIVDDAIANTFKGAHLTIETFGNMLKARIDHGAQEAKLIINYIPFIAKKTSESIIDGLIYSLIQSFWYSNFRYLKNDIQTSVLTNVLRSEKSNLIGLIDFVWKQGVGAELSANEKEALYRELLSIVNTHSNPPEDREQLFLLIGYAAIHDSDLQNLSVSWLLFKTNHTKNIIGAIRDRSKGSNKSVATMLETLEYKAIYKMFPEIKAIHETLLLPAIVNRKTDINEYIDRIREKLKSNEQQQKIVFTTAALIIASMIFLLFNKNSQRLQSIKDRLPPWLFDCETVAMLALVTVGIEIIALMRQQNTINEELLQCIDKLGKHDGLITKQLEKELKDELGRQLNKIKLDMDDSIKLNVLQQKNLELRQELQISKQAISYLFDKMKDTSKVAFKTGKCNIHGEILPIPDGFEKEYCSFLTTSWGHSRHGYSNNVHPHVSHFDVMDRMLIPNDGDCHWQHGAYAVLAAKPTMTQEEAEEKKRQYRLS